MVTATLRRRAVDHVKSRRVSERRACRLTGFSRSAAWRPLKGRNDARYQIARYPHWDRKFCDWSNEQPADPVPGFRRFADAAPDAGVTLFFVTNKPCLTIKGVDDPCPYEKATIDELREAGVETDRDRVLMAGERPEWDKEKLSRREFVAATHRVIMLIGDELSDFIPCVRHSPAGACAAPATAESRLELLDEYAH